MQRLREYSVRLAFPGHGPILDNTAFHNIIENYLHEKGEA
jgi:hypothetical protein